MLKMQDSEIGILRPSIQAQYEVAVTEGIVYGEAEVTDHTKVSKTSLQLDFYEPIDALEGLLRPIIVLVHGGGFFRGSRQEPAIVRAATEYAARGYTAMSISYRLGCGPEWCETGIAGPFPVVSDRVAAYQKLIDQVETVQFVGPENKEVDGYVRLGQAAALDDTLTAFDWLVEQAESRLLDLSRLVMFGGSAGSLNSLHTAYALDDLGIDALSVAAVIDHWGSFNLDDDDIDTDGTAFMEAGEAPIFIVHGAADKAIPMSKSQEIVQRAKEIGIHVELNVVAEGGHGFKEVDIFSAKTSDGQTIFERSVEFLDRVLFEF